MPYAVYPLSEPTFERMNSLNPPSILKRPLVWNENVYALGRDYEDDGKLYKYSLLSNEWSSFSVPSSIYASHSVLTTYNSKLLLISGKNMTLWEFSNNDFAFKESCIKPIPSKYCSDILNDNVLTTSSDEYLIIVYADYQDRSRSNLLIYNGRDWKFRHRLTQGGSVTGKNIYMAAIDSHAVYEIILYLRRNHNVGIRRTLIPSYDEIKDEDMAPRGGEMLEMNSLEEFNALLHRRSYSIIIQDQQFYCVDSEGIIFTAFIQPPILPIVWGNSGVNFDYLAPHLVRLPDGALLMIGTIDGSQLDVIKVGQKGNVNHRIFS